MMRWLLMLTWLVYVTPVQAEDGEAKQLFQKMEAELGSARVLQVSYEQQRGASPVRMNGTILLAEGNRLRWTEQVKGDPTAEAVVLLADGKAVVVLGVAPELAKPAAVAGDLRRVVLQAIVQQGAWTFKEVIAAARDADAQGPRALPMGGFVLKGKEKIGKREARVISYRLGIKNTAELPVTLWLDTQTGLPLKRATGEGRAAITETYTQIALDPKIVGEPFALQEILRGQARGDKAFREMEKSIRTAASLRILLEAEQREGEQESRLKGSVVLGSRNKVRIELTRSREGKTEALKLVSDGNQAVGEGETFDTSGKAVPVPEGLNEQLAALLARVGVQGLLAPGAAGPDGKFSIDLAAPLLSVAPVSCEKFEGREVEVFRVRTRMHRVRQSVTVWVDAKTHLPLQRVTVWKGGKLTETYTEFEVDPRLDAGLFELPKRK